MAPISRDDIRYNPPPPRMTATEAMMEEPGRGSGVGAVEEEFQISRKRMKELFMCAAEVCTVLDKFRVAPVEGCRVRRFVEELWRLK